MDSESDDEPTETLAMARVFEKIRAQIGLAYPWDEEGEGAAKKARR